MPFIVREIISYTILGLIVLNSISNVFLIIIGKENRRRISALEGKNVGDGHSKPD